jgi:hypothetical protein
MLLIFAIGYSGFTAAAHAFGPISSEKAQAVSMASCVDCQTENTDNGDNDDNGKASNGCMSCHHCCGSQLGFHPDFSINIEITAGVLSPLPDQVPTDSHISTLLRPPKTLV